jgi:hypothetical protein
VRGRFELWTAGQRFSNYFHWEQRLRTGKVGKLTAFEALEKLNDGDPVWVKKLQYAQASYDKEEWATLDVLRNETAARSVGQFSAHIAKSVCELLQARRVLDPCAGWGDRLSGFLAASCVREATLIEPRYAACGAYHSQKAAVSLPQPLSLQVLHGCAEDVMLGLPDKGYDLILTSPPYSRTELYPYDPEHDADQAHLRYDTAEAFADGFLRPFLFHSARLLALGGTLAINIDNTVEAPRLCEFVLECAPSVGLQLVGTAGYRKRLPNPAEPIVFFTRHENVDAVLRRLQPRAAAAAPELPPPREETHEGVYVVRDDLLPGGTKRRGLTAYVAACPQYTEFVYASPREGYAQLALAYACRDLGKRATIFVPQAGSKHELTVAAESLGAQVFEVPFGMKSVLECRARGYAAETGAHVVPFGCDHPIMIEAITRAAASIGVRPREVVSVVSSGVLSRGLQAAFPSATVFGVCVGHNPTTQEFGRAQRIEKRYDFQQVCPESERPPFPSSLCYDSKGWLCARERARKSRGVVLFWNVGR